MKRKRKTQAERREETREQVLAAAARVFAQRGFHGTSLEAIAEEAGFSAGWISDHFFLDTSRYGGTDDPAASVEPFVAIGALAARTKKLRLGTLVACAPFRHPAHVAMMSVRQTSRSDLLFAGTRPGQRTMNGTRCPPS